MPDKVKSNKKGKLPRKAQETLNYNQYFEALMERSLPVPCKAVYALIYALTEGIERPVAVNIPSMMGALNMKAEEICGAIETLNVLGHLKCKIAEVKPLVYIYDCD